MCSKSVEPLAQNSTQGSSRAADGIFYVDVTGELRIEIQNPKETAVLCSCHKRTRSDEGNQVVVPVLEFPLERQQRNASLYISWRLCRS